MFWHRLLPTASQIACHSFVIDSQLSCVGLKQFSMTKRKTETLKGKGCEAPSGKCLSDRQS